MKLKQWTKLQTTSILKTLSLSIYIFLLPCLLVFLFLSQSKNIDSIFYSNSKFILVSIQTGDLFQLKKALAGMQTDKLIYNYTLIDREGNILDNYQSQSNQTIVFEKELPILSSDNIYWGKIRISWILSWDFIFYFILGATTICIIVWFPVRKSLEHFTLKLIKSIERIPYLNEQSEMPKMITEIDELKDVFNKVRKLRQNEIEIEIIRSQREKEKELIKLSQKVSHDIKAPVTALSIVLGNVKLDGEMKNLVNSAFRRITEICDDLLIERKLVQHCDTTLGQAIVEISHETRFRHKNKTLEIESLELIENEKIPNNEFKSVLSNLLENAFEAISPINGIVKLKIEKTVESVLLKIEDNGHGIPPNILSQLGNRPLTFGKGEKGNGLGFYNAKSWAHHSGGELSITSQVGIGTQVTLNFPKEPSAS